MSVKGMMYCASWQIILGLSMLMLVGCNGSGPVVEQPTPPTRSLDEYESAHPDLTPQEVVRIQVEALADNDADNNGIARTFEFASPDNKRATGPLPRFIMLLNNPMYQGMLNHKRAIYGTMEIQGDTAQQTVTIVDQADNETTYLFTLSKQTAADYAGAWMTDSVLIISPDSSQDADAI